MGKTYDKEIQMNPFFEMNDEEFEDLCLDLFAKNHEAVHARRLFGKGYKQFGGDILVYVDDATTYVVQCKHYPKAEFPRGKIDDAVDLFLKYWKSDWKAHNVKRLYLTVSRPFTTPDQLAAIQAQIEHLKTYGIQLIAWDQKDLERELKPHREIVKAYFRDYFWGKICPPEPDTAGKGFLNTSVAEQMIHRNLDQMSSVLSESIRKELEPIRHLSRCGKKSESIAHYFELKKRTFEIVDAKTRAELLSLEIRLSFPEEMKENQATRLIGEILTEDPDFDTSYLEAIIIGQKKGYAAALEKLEITPDVSTFNLKLAFLLNIENYARARSLYEANARDFSYTAETKRLYALALLAEGNLPAAEEIIEIAAIEQPEWEGIRLTKAIILYYSALTSFLPTENPLFYPQPRPWHLVKNDVQSRERRREASLIFRELSEIRRAEKSEAQLFECWYLASLADDPERWSEANAYAQSVLEAEPTRALILIWALGRNFQVNYSNSKSELEEKFIKAGQNIKVSEINESVVLLPLYLKDHEFTKAKRHLQKLKPRFVELGESDLAAYWECQIAIASGDLRSIENRLSQKIQDVDLKQSIQIAALVEAVQKRHNRRDQRLLERRMKKLVRKSRDPHYHWLYAQFCHSQQKWDEITMFAYTLIEKIPTEETLRLVCDAFYQSRRPEKCLKFLEENRHLFRHGELPDDLSRIEAHCLLSAGKPTRASEVARKIFDKSKTPENLMTLVETHRHAGDMRTIETAVEQMQSLDALTPGQSLHISKIIASINPELAIKIWRQFKDRIKETKYLVDSAFFLGSRLGLGKESEELLDQMVEATELGENTHRLLTVAQWRKMNEEQTRHVQEVERDYYEGRIPVHLISKEERRVLAARYHLISNLNGDEDSIRNKISIFIRHGNRRAGSAENLKNEPTPRLHLDITALLLAHHLKILDKLEMLAPIFVTKEMIPLLQKEIEQLNFLFEQANVDAAKSILRAISEGVCQKSVAEASTINEESDNHASLKEQIGDYNARVLLEAVKEQSFIICRLPLRDRQNGKEVKMSPELQEPLRDLQSLVGSLISHGLMSTAQIEKCRAEIELNGDAPIKGSLLPLGAKLHLIGSVAKDLARLDILKTVCRNYRVFLDERDERILREEVRKAEDYQKAALWLQELQSRLKKGFENEIYSGISEEKLFTEDKEKVPKAEDYRLRSLTELLLLSADKEDVAVIDDRCLSGFPTINHGAQIFTIYEVLLLLNARDCLTEDEYYEKLLQLRKENFRYLPVTRQEIIYHLERSGDRLDSPELTIIRQYLASCMLDDRWLQRPPRLAGTGNYAEMEFVFACQRAVVEAISEVWINSPTIKEAHSKADTLLFNFYIGRFMLRHFFPDYTEHAGGSWHMATDYTDLSLPGIGILSDASRPVAERLSRAAAFFNWLNYIFEEHLRFNPAFIETAVEYLSLFLTHTIDETEKKENALLFGGSDKQTLFQIEMLFLNNLPEPIRQPLFENEAIRKKFDLDPELTFSINGLQFLGNELWEAVEKALRGEKAQVKWKNNNDEILELSGTEATSDRVEIKFSRSDGKHFSLSDGVLGVLLPGNEQRLNFIRSQRHLYDCSEEELLLEADRILAIMDSAERVSEFGDWTRRSAEFAYEHISQAVKSQSNFSCQQILAFPYEGLPRHFRFSEELDIDDFDQFCAAAAERLFQEEGIETALKRFGRFPKAIPEILLDKIHSLSMPEKKNADRQLPKKLALSDRKTTISFTRIKIFAGG